MVENAYFVSNIQEISQLPDDCDIVYLGSEYCIKAYPTDLTGLIKEVEKKYKFSVIIPPILESDLDVFHKILKRVIQASKKSFEIVINDWGILYKLYKEISDERINFVIGRMLSYQKRGNQKLYDNVRKEELGYVPVLNQKMIDFLKKLKVKRIEIDYPYYGINIEEVKGIGISVYSPFSVLSYTINCPYTFNESHWTRRCGRECLNTYLIYFGGDAQTPFYQHGKIYYSETRNIYDKADRIVHLSWKNGSIQI